MATTKCAKGHIYDPNVYGVCPYCNSQHKVINFAPGEEDGKTAPIGAQVGFGATEEMGHAQGGIGVTAPGGMQGSEIGHTLPLDQDITQPPWKKTEILDPVKNMNGNRPIVGWLVCINGPEKGKDYRLFTGKNWIGRSEKNDVSIKKDNTISGEKQAAVAYESKKGRFHLIDSDGSNTNYLNDEPIYGQAELKPYDVIEMGKTRLVFVPFCGEHFMWAAEEKAAEGMKAGETAWMHS